MTRAPGRPKPAPVPTGDRSMYPWTEGHTYIRISNSDAWLRR
jgi:hypothetical protein